ncbi:MAG: (d)CMP kinase [Planctomycetaceae bacterium]|nr:(d)CMP kinase [Planctomycetaceae bacterium]
MIVAIDGPSASGKSTAARNLAARLGLRFLDTGAMYRAVTWVALERGIDPADAAALEDLARSLEMSFDDRGLLFVLGKPVEAHIRGPRVTGAVSQVSAHGGVRMHVVARQRELAREWGGLVAEGRDTSTVVFPQADHKFFLWASAKERARRRAEEIGQPEAAERIAAELEARDRFDSTRAIAPLRQASDAVRIDSDGLLPDQVVDALERAIHEAGGAGQSGSRRSTAR